MTSYRMSLIRHWRGHTCCARRLECKSGQGCLWKLARHLWTLLQWWHKWERTQTSVVCRLNDLLLANTSGHHKAFRRRTWYSPNGQHNQIDYILVRKHLWSGVNSAGTQKFSRSRHWNWPQLADDDLPPSLEKNQQAKTHRLKFEVEKL